MRWKGYNLNSYGDLMSNGIDRCDTREEAQEFMKLYLTMNPNAYANIGYMSGYYGHDDAKRIRDWFGVVHPIFGDTNPTPDEAYRAGLEWGKNGSIDNALQETGAAQIRSIVIPEV